MFLPLYTILQNSSDLSSLRGYGTIVISFGVSCEAEWSKEGFTELEERGQEVPGFTRSGL